MADIKRYLEIDHRGVAFHEPSMDSPFSRGVSTPPKEILFCDCAGVGVTCHHIYAGAEGEEDRHFNIHGHEITVEHADDWKKRHSGKRCAHRRQFFVDVTDRPEAKLGMAYDEATDTFSAPKKV